MRWIDIDLTELPVESATARHFDEIRDLDGKLLAVQERAGLDHPRVVEHMRAVGHRLFRAVIEAYPKAFAEGPESPGAIDPLFGLTENNKLVGYHFVVPPRWVALPWTWLHNGIAFLLEKHPLTAAPTSSRLPAHEEGRPWMRRCAEAALCENLRGDQALRQLLPQLRPVECADPEILFVPGHCREEIRGLIYREADGIRRALATSGLPRRLAKLSIPEETITPGTLSRRGCLYQGLHFAAATAQPLDAASAEESAWLDDLVAAAEVESGTSADLGGEYEEEMEILGVDPDTAMLDTVAAMADSLETSKRAQSHGAATAGTAVCRPPAWILEDGPFQPEEMGRGGPVPALVFSNSYLSMPTMGERFLRAGASVFIGPLAPLYSRPARNFAGRFYDFLGDGHSIGAALRLAALACRERFGAEHPVWLSYGAAGYGTLALQYL